MRRPFSCLMRLPLLFVGLLLGGCATASPFCAGALTPYELVPSGRVGPRPSILLLHGAGGSPADVIEPWRALAAREGLVLIAPRLPRTEAFEAAAPAVFKCVQADAAKRVSIDPARQYLFGYSMGGYLAFDGALLAADTFAGAAIYANGIAEPYRGLVDRASRKLPIALYVGTLDPLLPLARETRELLERKGFEVHAVEYPGVDHRLGPVAAELTEDAWRFLSSSSATR